MASGPFFPFGGHSLSLKLGQNSPAGTPMTAGLVFHLAFDNNLLDSSPTAAHQTDNVENGPLAFTTDRVNGTHASEWDATGPQYIRTGVTNFDGTSLFTDATNHLTVAVWVNNDVAGGGMGVILSRGMESSQGFRLRVTNTSLEIHLRGQLSSYTFNDMGDGEWHHVALTWDGSAGVAYIDGVAQMSALVNGTNDEDPGVGPQNIFIGAADSVNGGLDANMVLHYDELMDDLMIWNRGLSASEIASLAGV